MNFKAAKPIDTGNGAQFADLLKKHKISKPEYERILAAIDRIPSLTELGVFSAMWSEHCSYKSSRVHLRRFPTTGANVVVGPGENAGVVRLHGRLCLAFKMESHNHPSYIEPFQGAATGVGGILRDVFCMGARPIANLNCLRFGERSHPKTEYIAKRAVQGIGGYGNCIGVPTVGGNVSYDKTYNGNCLVNAMTVGLIDDDKIFKGFASGVGNLVVYLGSATGRDGVNGASMASDSFSAADSGERSTVQVGDPYAEKLLLEATLEVLEKNLVVGIQDMGAAGLTSSSFEMAGRAGNGVRFDLDRVPLRAKNMSAYEIMLSESQERMLMVVEPGKWQELESLLSRWGLSCAVIGVVTDTGRVEVNYKGVLEVNLPVAPLTDLAPVYHREVGVRKTTQSESKPLDKLAKDLLQNDFAREIFLKALHDTGSVKPIYEQYDQHVGARTVLGPDGGGAAILWINTDETKDNPWLGAAVATACNERRVKNNPKKGAADAVLSCVKSIAAAGGTALAVTDCLNFGSPEDPKVMREFSDSVDGISDACKELNIPVVSGNVSLYNSTDGESIYPTPMIGVVGKVADVRLVTPAILKGMSSLWLLSSAQENHVNYAASLVAKLAGVSAEDGEIDGPDWENEKKAMDLLSRWRTLKFLSSVRPVAQGGVGLTAAKMILGRIDHTGEHLNVNWIGEGNSFFEERAAAYVIEFSIDAQHSMEAIEHATRKIGFRLEKITEVGEASAGTQWKFPFGDINQDMIVGAWKTAHRM